MTFREAFEGGLQSAVNWVFVAVVGGIVWGIRRIFTNQKQIEALQSAIEHRDKEHKRDMQEVLSSFQRLEEQQKEMRDDIKNLFQR